jgi:hypothetical protein
MTATLTVNTVSLSRLAERIRRAAVEARATSAYPGPLLASIGALTVPCLVQAADTFVASWSTALADLVDDADRLADAVDLLARAFRDAESVNARLLGHGNQP